MGKNTNSCIDSRLDRIERIIHSLDFKEGYCNTITLNPLTLMEGKLTVSIIDSEGKIQSQEISLQELVGSGGDNISGLTFNSENNKLTIHTTSGGEFSEYINPKNVITNINTDGTVTLISGGEDILKIAKVAISGNYNDLKNKPNLSNFVTKNELDSKNYITSVTLDGYATKNWVQSQNYANINLSNLNSNLTTQEKEIIKNKLDINKLSIEELTNMLSENLEFRVSDDNLEILMNNNVVSSISKCEILSGCFKTTVLGVDMPNECCNN